VIAVDTNILIYAFFEDFPLHSESASALASLAEGLAPWAIPWPCIHEFYGVVTNPKLFPDAGIASRARAQIEAWMESPSLQLLHETADHWKVLSRVLDASGAVGPAVHDAKIAVICIANRVSELLTMDRDFSRFKELKVVGVT
jgi:toxin-antitoxin system PIN domain toxin